MQDEQRAVEWQKVFVTFISYKASFVGYIKNLQNSTLTNDLYTWIGSINILKGPVYKTQSIHSRQGPLKFQLNYNQK